MEFTLRPFSSTDAIQLAEVANNPKIADNLTNKFPNPYSLENAKDFIAFATSDVPNIIFAIDIDNKVGGAIGLHPQDDIMCKNAEMGYWLAEKYWGNNIITRAIPEMVDYGFKQLEINRIFARPFGTNIGSQRVLEKAGFKLEGRFEKTIFKNDRYEDELVYAIRKA